MVMMQVDEPLSRVGVKLEELANFARRHKLIELSIFGSILRDDFRAESDVDVLYESAPGEEVTIEKLISMRAELETLFGRRVDLVRKSLLKNPYRRAHIMRNRRIVYAA